MVLGRRRSRKPTAVYPSVPFHTAPTAFGRNVEKHPEWVGVRMGTFDEDPGVRPSVRGWVGSAAPWEPIPEDGLPQHVGSRYGS